MSTAVIAEYAETRTLPSILPRRQGSPITEECFIKIKTLTRGFVRGRAFNSASVGRVPADLPFHVAPF